MLWVMFEGVKTMRIVSVRKIPDAVEEVGNGHQSAYLAQHSCLGTFILGTKGRTARSFEAFSFTFIGDPDFFNAITCFATTCRRLH